jgi:hypothetical protein
MSHAESAARNPGPFPDAGEKPLLGVTVNGKAWKKVDSDWVILPGNIGSAGIIAAY